MSDRPDADARATGATGPQGPAGLGVTPGYLVAPAYDSGWVDITYKAGQTFTLTHDLGSTDIVVDATGRQTQADTPHRLYLGLGGYRGFEAHYGGTYIEEGYSIVYTRDRGYAIAGFTVSYDNVGASDVYLVKTDRSGDM